MPAVRTHSREEPVVMLAIGQSPFLIDIMEFLSVPDISVRPIATVLAILITFVDKHV
jgi:hypothetical protein